MVAKCHDGVVNDDGLAQWAPQSAQVLHIGPFLYDHAVLSVQAVMEVLVLWVEQFNASVSICFLEKQELSQSQFEKTLE